MSRVRELIEQLRSGAKPAPLEVVRRHRDGSGVRVRLTLSAILDNNGAPKAPVSIEQHLD